MHILLIVNNPVNSHTVNINLGEYNFHDNLNYFMYLKYLKIVSHACKSTLWFYFHCSGKTPDWQTEYEVQIIPSFEILLSLTLRHLHLRKQVQTRNQITAKYILLEKNQNTLFESIVSHSRGRKWILSGRRMRS